MLPSWPRAAGTAKAAGPGRSPAVARSRVRILAIAGAATAVTAVVALAPGVATARAASLTQPAIAVADGDSVIAEQTGGNGLRFYWNEHGTSTWHGEQVAPDGTTFSARPSRRSGRFRHRRAGGRQQPGLLLGGQRRLGLAPGDGLRPGDDLLRAGATVNGNSVNIAADGPGNSLDFYLAVNGSSAWTREVVAGAGTTTSAPAIAVNKGSVNWSRSRTASGRSFTGRSTAARDGIPRPFRARHRRAGHHDLPGRGSRCRHHAVRQTRRRERCQRDGIWRSTNVSGNEDVVPGCHQERRHREHCRHRRRREPVLLLERQRRVPGPGASGHVRQLVTRPVTSQTAAARSGTADAQRHGQHGHPRSPGSADGAPGQAVFLHLPIPAQTTDHPDIGTPQKRLVLADKHF